jgi:hypothetical protein
MIPNDDKELFKELSVSGPFKNYFFQFMGREIQKLTFSTA